MDNVQPTFKSEIERLLAELEDLDPWSEDYAKTVNNLRTLVEAEGKKASWLKPEIIAPIIGGIIQIGMILSFEHAHVLTSKAISFVRRS